MRSEVIDPRLLSSVRLTHKRGGGRLDEILTAALDRENSSQSPPNLSQPWPEPQEGRAAVRGLPSERDVEPTVSRESKMRNVSPETAIVRSNRRGEISMEETMLALYYSAVSIRGVEDISETLWGSRVSPSLVSELGQVVARRIETALHQAILGDYPYVMLDFLQVKQGCEGGFRFIHALLAVGVNAQGYREILGMMAGTEQNEPSWLMFLQQLKRRGLTKVQLFVGGWSPELPASLAQVFPRAAYLCSIGQFYQAVSSFVHGAQCFLVLDMLKSIHGSATDAEARVRMHQIGQKLNRSKIQEAAALFAQISEFTLSYFAMPRPHWGVIRTNESLTRITRKIRERDRVVRSIADGKTAVLFVAARLRHLKRTGWDHHAYMKMV